MLFRLMGLTNLAYVALLLTASFFVLLALRKIEDEGLLKAFGRVLVVFLWLAAATVFLAEMTPRCSGYHPFMKMMQEAECKKCGQMPGMMSGHKEEMMKGAMPAMPQGKHK